MRVGKRSNEYAARLFLELDGSKTVYMAIAFSLAMRVVGDDVDKATALVREEWATLHANGILPQAPRDNSKANRDRLTGGAR